jgi:protein-S-isoprenylcysteine O-methyltransferase Ste14
MFSNPFGWFPNPFFADAFPTLIFAIFLIDYLIPRLNKQASRKAVKKEDKGSYFVVAIATFTTIVLGMALRWLNLGTWTGLFQWAGLFISLGGLVLRVWALVKLGRFFSRTVQIESEHKIVTYGPYRWIRHPAYTGMILIYTGIVMCIGTWLGALLSFVIITSSLYYRIQIEEKVLLASLGDEYLRYMENTRLLFPGC